MADRRFDLPGQIAAPLPTTFPRPDPRPISAEAPQPATAPEAPPEPPADEATAAQGGPYIPPTPERVADLDPQPIEPRQFFTTPDTPAHTLPLAGRDGEGGEPTPVAQSEPPTAAIVAPAPELAPLVLATAPEPSPPVLAPMPPPPTLAPPTVAAGPEWLPEPGQPSIAAPLALAPTIDAIELDGARNFVSGTGPAGALMRLFADDEVVGEGSVEDGHWVVETAPLLTAPRLELRIEAIDPDSGRSLGESEITVEIQLPPDAEPFAPTPSDPAPDTSIPAEPPAQPEPKPQPALTAQTDPPTTVVVAKPAAEPEAAPQPAPLSSPEVSKPQPVAEAEPTTVLTPVPPVPQSRPTPRKLPGLLPVTPQRSSPSVLILGPAGDSPSTAVLD